MSLSKNDYTPLSKIEEVPSLPKIKHNHENASGWKKKASTHHGHKTHNWLYTPINLTWRDHEVDPERKVVYKKIHQYGKQDYLIEISKNSKRMFIVSLNLKNEKY